MRQVLSFTFIVCVAFVCVSFVIGCGGSSDQYPDPGQVAEEYLELLVNSKDTKPWEVTDPPAVLQTVSQTALGAWAGSEFSALDVKARRMVGAGGDAELKKMTRTVEFGKGSYGGVVLCHVRFEVELADGSKHEGVLSLRPDENNWYVVPGK